MTRTCFTNVPTFVSHLVALPECCPVSGNPAPGSLMRVSYQANGVVVPVENLEAWVQEYVGGHALRNIRGMEEMIQDIAQRCADETQVPVRVVAGLMIKPPFGGQIQQMRVSARGRPA